jgi:hypothetical protein
MKIQPLVIASLGVMVCLVNAPASAGRYDIILGRLCTTDSNNQIICSQEKFESLMTELGLIIAPVFLAPAETLGLTGFEFSLEGTVAPIHNSRNYWKGKIYPTDSDAHMVSASEGNPQSLIFIPRLHIRKGLPFSFEIGAQLSYIPESEMFTIGAEVKWAFNEGLHNVPDFAVRISMNHMIGPSDFELSTGGWDISISKAFGLGGLLSLTPYAGYNMLFIDASAHTVLVMDDPALSGSAGNQPWVFHPMKWQDNMHHRFFIGCRLITYIFQFVVEGAFSKEASLFNVKIGFDY